MKLLTSLAAWKQWIQEEGRFAEFSRIFRHDSALTATMSAKKQWLGVELKSKSYWSVRMGPLEWAKHTYARSAGDPLELLGSARHGLQSGALARLGDEFVLVVGDHVTALSHSDNKDLAAAAAQVTAADRPFVFQPIPRQTAPPPIVVIKRRRVPAPN